MYYLIGQLAEKANCTVETIRYYEKKGLLKAASRNKANHYRQYTNAHLETLYFIRRCRSLDLSLAEIQSLIEAKNKPSHCKISNQVIEHHIAILEEKISQFQRLNQELVSIKNQCSHSEDQQCEIIQALASTAA